MIHLIASLRATHMKIRLTIRSRLGSPLNMGMAIVGVLRWRALQWQVLRWRARLWR
jgi:hypothetical protein